MPINASNPISIAKIYFHSIKYVCLYAIGLRGKEIGSYLDLARHYSISSDVRRKLGLGPNAENLGPFIRGMMSKDK